MVITNYWFSQSPHREIDIITDAAHKAYALYRLGKNRDYLNSAINKFQTVLAHCPDGHPYRAAALCNLAHPILYCFTEDVQIDFDYAISLFCSALALRPQGHPDRPLSIHDLCRAYHLRYSHRQDHADLHMAVKLYLELLPMCVDGSYLQLCVFEECNSLPGSPSDESIALRRMVLYLCPRGHQCHARSLSKLARDLSARFKQSGNINDINEAVCLTREALSLHPPGHPSHQRSRNNLAKALKSRYDRYGDITDLEEAKYLDQDPHTGTSSPSQQIDPRYGQEIHIRDEGQRPQPVCALTAFELHRCQGLLTVLQPRMRSRNVVIFGETGAGKSSVINAIAQYKCAETSGEATGCTRRHKKYNVEISEKKFVIFDTPGLNEGTEGKAQADRAAKNLKGLLRTLGNTGSGGIGLLVYCVRGTRSCRALFGSYNYVYSKICQGRVPIVLVATGLEDYGPTTGMESWWENNRTRFDNHGMSFKDHACVTTIPEEPHTSGILAQRIRGSCESLRSLILNNCLE